MDQAYAYHDPLKINLKRQTQNLLSKLSTGSPFAAALVPSSSPGELLATLSSLLLVPSLTLAITSAFRPILIPLCAQWLTSDDHLDEKFVALCLLIQPHEELFPILSRLLRKPTFLKGPLAFVLESQTPKDINKSHLHQLLLAYYRVLMANPTIPDIMSWPLSALSTLFWTPHPDTGVRLLAIRCYALQSGMGEAEREKLEVEVLGPSWEVDCQIDYGQDINGHDKEIDGWLMPALEEKRIMDMRNAIFLDTQEYFFSENDEDPQVLSPQDLSSLVVNVHGILLLRCLSESLDIPSSIIHTPRIAQSLRSLAIHLSQRLPTLLTSIPSSGKSLLLSHLASSVHSGHPNQIIYIQLADASLDPRSLLGAYVSSPTEPGTFEWKEGVLIRAMREGKWVVFKDVDRGTNEVLGIVKPLVESLGAGNWVGGVASLDVPGRGRVDAHEDFAIFATRSLVPSNNGKQVPPSFFGASKFHEIVIEPPSLTELKAIIISKNPLLGFQMTDAMIRLWDDVRALGSAASTRDVGYRELEKFCCRVEHLMKSAGYSGDQSADSEVSAPSLQQLIPNPTIREEMFCEARDVFFGAGANTTSAHSHLEAIAVTIAQHLELDADRREWVLHRRVPEIFVEKDTDGRNTALRIGRTTLRARQTKSEISSPVPRPFALHRPAILLLSRIAAALSFNEPILLTGETGTGKTSVVTYMASVLNRPLFPLNLSHQTESSDLVGGFKPIDTKVPATQLQERFLDLFGDTFSRQKNAKFEESVRKAILECKWKRVAGLWKESVRLAKERLRVKQAGLIHSPSDVADDPEAPRKRRRMDRKECAASEARWSAFERDVNEFEVQHVQGKGKLVFGFVGGPLVKALRSGHWVLLDEINLASAESLECISGLLRGPSATITLTEQGSLEPVPRHPDFRLFACMNPATDVGKKDLPPNIRCRFTEIDVPPPDTDQETLLSIVSQYIGHNAIGDKAAILNVAEFYLAVKKLVHERQIADGSSHVPHYSIRTLTRALTFASDMASVYGLRRALWEGCLMAFTMVLDSPSSEIVIGLARQYLLAGVRNPQSLLSKEPSTPRTQPIGNFVKFGPFYLPKGPLPEDPVEDYIITPSVEKKLIGLARIMITGRYPVLIEGPTSSGKTSSVEYLARRTGHRIIRINNHEHTDIQEYLGSYVSDQVTGKLVFKDGLLVRALREGHWIVLDELNLAPTDVLEALNRLLDDNRELVIPETQEVVRPHPRFMLFATQNPPGLYAGRKILSRAFRSRFLEVHFQDVPPAELEYILGQKCQIAPSYATKIVNTFHELQKRRQSGRVFESRHSFATLRDLFRWAGRDAVGYQQLAENGYMLLAERARQEDDKRVVKEVIEQELRVKIDEKTIYSIHNPGFDYSTYLGCTVPSSPHLVWTSAMQRLFILVARALRFNEPVLLVGETGSGKTSVCQIYADAIVKQLLCLNCHQNSETADLIGGLRPIRNRAAVQSEVLYEISSILSQMGFHDISVDKVSLLSSIERLLQDSKSLSNDILALLNQCRRKIILLDAIFEWRDGPLVKAMRQGDVFLLDEISLADDSVLERLNSVLEPSRTIILAERGGDDIDNAAVQALDTFKIIATMNPGGDYGKKELSPALRNRFTEIWVPPVHARVDLELIISSSWEDPHFLPYTNRILDFVDWFVVRVGDPSVLGLRDILAWVNFSNSVFRQAGQSDNMSADCIFHHAACMTVLDGLNSLPQLASYSAQALQDLKTAAISKLQELAPLGDAESSLSLTPSLDSADRIKFGLFDIEKRNRHIIPSDFHFEARTTLRNAVRIARAYQLPKAILLEGSPGVGKTSLVTALAQVCGHALYRINLSDQTDLVDLFGSDLPVDGGQPGEFAWREAEFLKAMQEGHWVLLDEMNLAPQAILEGLNAVLDHRGVVFIPELGRSFVRHPSFRVFAAQNPLHQGGGRKGLPKSFINRFTKVYLDDLTSEDLISVCCQLFPDYQEATVRAMIAFNTRLNEEIVSKRSFGREGSPWEFNLRDVIRWARLMSETQPPLHPIEFLGTIYLHRLRTATDRECARLIFEEVFSMPTNHLNRFPCPSITSSHLRIGNFLIQRQNMVPKNRSGRLLQMQLPTMEALGHSVNQSWLTIITGHVNTGKTQLVRTLAHTTGNILTEIYINNGTDTMDLLGSFEQVHNYGRIRDVICQTLTLITDHSRTVMGSQMRRMEAFTLLQDASRTAITPAAFPHVLQVAADLLTEPMILNEDLNNRRENLLHKIKSIVSVAQKPGRFKWVDGPLVRAIRDGHWALLDGANLCNASVLDRLNSLCEPKGFLVLSEKGFFNGKIQSLVPHPNFRLFMTVDPQYGELSRAMRNRGIEIALLAEPTAKDCTTLRDYIRLPTALTHRIDMNVDVIKFTALRRALIVPTAQSPTSYVGWPSGLSLNQDSALLDSIERTSSLFPSGAIPLMDSFQNVFAQMSAPKYLPLVARLQSGFPVGVSKDLIRKTHALLRDVLPRFFALTATTREAYGREKRLPAAFVATQPANFFLNCPPCPVCNLETTPPSSHHLIIQLLCLLVTLYDYREDSDNDFVSKGTRQLTDQENGLSTRIVETVEMALDVVSKTSFLLLQLLDVSDTVPALRDVELATTLIRYCRHLRSVTENGVFHYSAVRAISKRVNKVLRDCSLHFTKIHHHFDILENAISVSTGFGLIEIWSAFSADGRTMLHTFELDRLDSLACSMRFNKDQNRLRGVVFDFMVSYGQQMAITGRQQTFVDLQHRIEELQRILKNEQGPESPNSSRIECSHLLGELIALSGVAGLHRAESYSHYLQTIIDLARKHTWCSLWRFAVYQNLISSQYSLPATISQCQIQWMRGLWNFENQAEGPLVILRPSHLQATLSICDWRRHSLASLEAYKSNLSHHYELTEMLSEDTSSRVCQLTALLHRSIMLIISCFSSSLGTPDWALDVSFSTNRLISILARLTDARLLAASQQSLHPALLRLVDDSNTVYQMTSELGRCWIALSKFLIDLYVPGVPIDPAAVQRCDLDIGHREVSILTSEIDLHSHIEQRIAGNSENSVIAYLKRRRDDVSRTFPDAPSFDTREYNPSRLHMFWQEVLEFQTQVISSSRMDNLCYHLDMCDQTARSREEAVQRVISGFLRRLDASYPEYSDVGTPFQLALLYLKLGLRLVAHAASCKANTISDALASLATALVAFPSIRSSEMVFANLESGQRPVIATSQHFLLKLAALTFELSLGVDFQDYALVIDTTYNQLLRLWLIDRARREDRETLSQSLYKNKAFDHDATDEAEAEEREFLALFPQYEDMFQLESTPQTAGSQHTGQFMDDTWIQILVDMHYQLLNNSGQISSAAIHSPKSFNDLRLTVVTELLDAHMASLPDTVDQESYAFQLSLVRECFSKHQENFDSSCRSYNFYVDANIPEMRKACVVVETLDKRLDDLLNQWPDHVVLQHMKNRCRAILNLDFLCPIARILSALEQLLTQSEDWEGFASNVTSLKTHLQALTRLIVDWRRLELSSWKDLLRTEAQVFANGASKWWFHLYNSTIRVPLDILDQPHIDNADHLAPYLTSMCPLLDGFMRSSPLGQYHSRLELLASFSRYVGRLALSKPTNIRPALRRVERLLHSTTQYFGQFDSMISSQLAQQRAPIENDLRSLIQLASWRDANVSSLKQSALKTHRQLFKCVRRFRDIMRQPVTQWLQPEQSASTEPDHQYEPIANEALVPPTPTLYSFPREYPLETNPVHLSNLDRTFQKFVSLITGPIHSAITSHTVGTVEDFSVEIIAATKMLSALSIPTNEPADRREKLRRGQLMWKRRAWSDLLKALKRAGFAANITSDELNRLRDVRWIREQPLSIDMPTKSTLIVKSEIYLCRLYGLLPELRASLADHHPDLTTRELQRGVNLLESGFSMALESKSCVVTALAVLHKLENTSRRLWMVLSSSEAVKTHLELLRHVFHIKNTICRFASALEELMQSLHIDHDLLTNRSTPTSLLDQISMISANTTSLRDRIFTIIHNMNLTNVQFVLHSEEVTIQEILEHLHHSSESLRQLSEQESRYNYLLRPVLDWLSSQRVMLPLFPAKPTEHPQNDADIIINSLLVNIQSLLTACERENGGITGSSDLFVRKDQNRFCQFTRLLKLNGILDQINAVIPPLVSQSQGALHDNLARVLPFLDRYLQLARDHLNAHSQWMKALCKLDYILCSVMWTIAKEGFCQPPDSNESQTGDDVREYAGGLGVGEGAGADNVSKEIEDESQVEGLQDDGEDSKGEQDGPAEENAIEMSEDFNGNTEDIPDTGSQAEDESDHESQPDVDDHLGNLDSADPSAVDEKLWGDDQTGSDQADRKADQGQSKQKEGASEVVAKENPSTDKSSDIDEKNQTKHEDESPPEANDDAQQPDAGGAPLDEFLPESDILDLPDDINFDDEKNSRKDSDIDMTDDEQLQGASDAEGDLEEPQTHTGDEPEDLVQEQQLGEDDVARPENDDNSPSMDKVAAGQPDVSSGRDAYPIDNLAHQSDGGNTDAEHVVGAGGTSGPDSNQDENVQSLNQSSEITQSTEGVQGSGKGSTRMAPEPSKQEPFPATPDERSSTKASRSVGDMHEITRRPFEQIQQSEDALDPWDGIDGTGNESQLQYLHPDDTDINMQALGPAGTEKVAKLQELKIVDDSTDNLVQPMDLDTLPRIEEPKNPSEKASDPTRTTDRDIDQTPDGEGAVIARPGPFAIAEGTAHSDAPPVHTDVEMGEEDKSTPGIDPENELRAWQAEGFPESGAEHLWRRYELMIHDLAYALCEQLRLILEPTLATRLKGDYRSGKRLNMKKIIPYIASDYTKDKIWLRRTKPSQREYQVLIALDDSRSMSESHSVHLAYQTLALVSKALGRLEVGDLAVVKFGEGMDILHGFDDGPFTDQTGIKVLSAFRFNQTSTNVSTLLDSSLRMLEAARERRSVSSQSAADLWQLEIIISDGICQNHEHLRTILRKAEEQRVMIVFIIVDSLSSSAKPLTRTSTAISQRELRNSILSMQQAAYKMVDGRMELQMQRYLDTFPFEYHVVLRSVEALPKVLSATLKQFFERLSEQ